MLSADELSEAVKSSGITVAGILFSAAIGALVIFIAYGSRSRVPSFVLDGKYYALIGVAKNEVDGKTFFVPVYEESLK